MSLGSALSLNMINMIGVGPFITLPLVVAAMGGPQAMLGWILGALIALCDGLVWSELGAALPRAGGSYAFLKEIYGSEKAGRWISFLYIWQLGFSAPLSIASGCIGLAQYAAYLWPQLNRPINSGAKLSGWHPSIPLTSLVAAATCVTVTLLLYRNVRTVMKMGWVLWGGVVFTLGAVIFAGFTHFHPALAFTLPPHALSLSPAFFEGLGAAMLFTTYDYWGYYNVTFLGGEVRDPGRNIPRAVMLSIVLVGALYLLLSVSVLGVLPWQELTAAVKTQGHFAVVAVVMQRTMGAVAGRIVAGLVMWTAFASVFALLMAYSRVPFAAARDGNYFRMFGRLHPRHGFPHISLLALGAAATLFCFFDLSHVITALVAIRILLQFVLQQAGVILLRMRQPKLARPFRIWLYPLPPLLAMAGFLFMLFSRTDAVRELRYAAAIALSGSVIYFARAFLQREWPFPNQHAPKTPSRGA
ncbi:MAG TPA: amino acid permease [Acidisarcina sp.]